MVFGKWNWRVTARVASRFEKMNWSNTCHGGAARGTVPAIAAPPENWTAVTEFSSATAAMSGAERLLWRRLREQRDLTARRVLIERYLRLAQAVAASMYAMRPDNSIEFAEYLQYARVGLMESVDRFDPERDVGFPSYAGHRIRGAILNGLETASELSAQKSFRREILKERAESLRGKQGEDRFAALVDFTISLALGYALEESGVWKEADESEGADPYRVCELRLLQERMTRILGALPERERMVIQEHYLEQRSFQEIAARLNLSKGRIAQVHRSALSLMRQAYEALAGFDTRY